MRGRATPPHPEIYRVPPPPGRTMKTATKRKWFFSCCHSIDFSMTFLNMKICSVVPLPGRKPACSFLSFDSTPVRILPITILPRTLLTTHSSVIPRQFNAFFQISFFRQFDNQFFPLFSWCLLVSPHYVYDLHDYSSSIVNVSFKQLCLYFVYSNSWCFFIFQMPYGPPYFSSARFQMYQFLLSHPAVLSPFHLLDC